jgi:transketolase
MPVMSIHKPDATTVQSLKDIANKLRISSIKMTNASNSGHPTSCCSAAEIMSVLFFNVMRYKPKEPRFPASDRFVMSKGHAAPILYAAWKEAGYYTHEDLMTLRKIDSDLEGHPTPRLPFVDVATGSLGQGLSCAAGIAWVAKNMDKANYRTYCLIGDAESSEGSIWEAMAFASHYELDNLVAIIDVNRLGQSDPTPLKHQMDVYEARVKAFGWNAIVVDGHDIEALCKAFSIANETKGKPTCILAKTFKGQGIEGIADQDNWHGKPIGAKAQAAIDNLIPQIQNMNDNGLKPLCPEEVIENLEGTPAHPLHLLSSPPAYKLGESVAVRASYGTALTKMGKGYDRIIALDGDMKNSTFSIKFHDAFPARFIECFVAEQNLVGVAIGAASRDRTVAFVSTFAAFLTRAFDQIRMGAVSMTNCNFVGSHCGVSIGEDGPSQMALEDIALFRSVPDSTVFYPSDAVSCERSVELAANTKGICFIRTTRGNTAVIYGNDEAFRVGQGKIVRQSPADKVLVIAAAVTLTESLKAAETLEAEGINIRILDPFTIKPIDADLILRHAHEVGGRILTVEDHYPEGGIGDAVAAVVAQAAGGKMLLKKLAVTGLPRSGPGPALLEMFGIGAKCIVQGVRQLIKCQC